MKNLIKRLIKGDEKAFEELVEIYDKKLFYIAFVRLKNENAAREAVQDTFVNVYLNVNCLKQVENLDYWIIRILINNCNRIYTERHKLISYEEVSVDFFIHEDSKEVVEDIEFLDMISFLDEEDRTIMILYYKYDLTTKQMSEILNMNENTLRTKLKRAKEKVKKRIEGENYER